VPSGRDDAGSSSERGSSVRDSATADVVRGAGRTGTSAAGSSSDEPHPVASSNRSAIPTAVNLTPLLTPLRKALERRREALPRWHAEGTDGYRLLHGVAEDAPGVAVDRYGPILLVQTWRDPLPEGALDAIRAEAEDAVGASLIAVWNHRVRPIDFARWHEPALPADPLVHELGVPYDARPRHRGQDPLLFLDLRAVRRRVLAEARGKRVLNLFAYTCGVGVCAARAGAAEVWNVDFAGSALDVGRRNAALSGVEMTYIQDDCLPVLRQLAGLPVGRKPARTKLAPRAFDVVVLDPPTRSTGPWGAVDIVRDYPSLFKPALLATAPGGTIVATNHAAQVDRAAFAQVLERAARKAGRPLASLEILGPEEDFPSFDAQPPLKIAIGALP
jgi:23S rRNA (cytosine1962-C5)-methyltransferase